MSCKCLQVLPLSSLKFVYEVIAMFYINAKNLVLLAVKHGVLQETHGLIPIYRDAGSPPEVYPEGWYLEDIEEVIQDLMQDEEGQNALINALSEKGVEFVPIDEDEFWRDSDRLDKIIENHFQDRKQEGS